MKYLYWRDRILWCRFPVDGWPDRYSLKIRAFGKSKAEKDRVERELGHPTLSRIQSAMIDPKAKKELERQLKLPIFENEMSDKALEPARPYRPKFWRLVARYWYHSLRYKRCAKDDRYHLMHSLKSFGNRYADDVHAENIIDWLADMKKSGAAVNAINNRLAKLKAVYNHAGRETNPRYLFSHNPTRSIRRVPGGRVRQVLLTPDKFERNYQWLIDGSRERYAFLYLLAWETGRRPEEISQYTWEMFQEVMINGMQVRYFEVPGEIVKTSEPDSVPISDRLWREMLQLGYRTGFVARNSQGNRWRNWEEHTKALRAKFPDGAHWLRDCRRGFATRKTEIEGHDPYHVRQVGGWKTESAFHRYRIGQLENTAKVVGIKKVNREAGSKIA